MLDLTGKTSFCDYFVLCNGNNPRHVRAIANHLLEHLRDEHGIRPLGAEGLEAGRWALLDYDDVLVHVFEQPARRYYDLEGLWLDARRMTLDELGITAPAPAVETDEAWAQNLP